LNRTNAVSMLTAKPVKYFSADFTMYNQCIPYQVADSSPVFWEDDCLIAYLRKGSGTVCVNTVPYPVEAGSLFILHANHVFQFLAGEDQLLELELLLFPYPEMMYLLDQASFNSMAADADLFSFAGVALDSRESQKAGRLLDTYREEADRRDRYSYMIRYSILAQLSQICFLGSLRQKRIKAAEEEPLCARLLTFIYRNCVQDLTPKDVAAGFGAGVPQLNRELRQVCGHSFWHVLNRARINCAYGGMLQSNVSLRTLSYLAGFSSETAYYRAFKTFKGCSPDEFKEKMKAPGGPVLKHADSKFSEIMAYLFENFTKPIDSKTGAKALFLSEDSINRTLCARYGLKTSFSRIMTTLRLRYARGLLGVSLLPVCDIAVNSGFKNVHTFIRLFKKEYGLTPGQYRAQLMSGADSQ